MQGEENGSNFALLKATGCVEKTLRLINENDDILPQDKPEVTLLRQRKKKDKRERPSLPVNEVSF